MRSFLFLSRVFLVFVLLNLVIVNQSLAQTIPASGDIVFTEFQTDNDVAEFITLKRLDLRNVGFTDNGILKSGALRTGEAVFTIPNTSNFADIPGGTFVRLVSTTGINDIDATDGIIVLYGTNFDLSTLGDQVIAYTGTFANPSFIAGINGGDTGGWNKGTTSDNNSKAPGTLSDIDVSGGKNNDNARLIPTLAVGGNVITILNSIKTTSNWEKNNNTFSNFALKNILFTESNFLSGSLSFSSVTPSGFIVNLSGLSFNNINADTRYMVVVNGGSSSNPVDRFTCYSGITDNISTSVSVVTAVGTPPCANPTPGNGKVVYFSYGLPASVIINGLSPNTSYEVKIFALNGNGHSANVSSIPATGNQGTLTCSSATISYPGSPFCNSITTDQVPTITGTSGGSFNYTGTGILSINTSTGAIVPSASTPGTYTVHYQIPASGSCGAVDATASIVVNATPIIANAISDINTSEDASPYSIDISNVFSDADGNSLAIEVSSSNPALVNADYNATTGVTLSYVSNANGTATIAVTARDACGAGTTDQFVVNVAAGNDAPVARDSATGGNEDAPLITGFVPASDVEGDNLTYSVVSGVDASKGTLTFNTNGTYSFVPALNFNGAASFTYKAYDGKVYSNVATVTITINPVNDAPVITSHFNNYAIPEDTYGFSIDLSNTFQDVDGDALTISIVEFDPRAFAFYNSTTKQLGFYTIGNANGFTITKIRASDGSAYVDYPIYLMIMPVNDAPSGTSKAITINQNVAYTFTQSDFGFFDEFDFPANNFKAVKLTTLPAAGNLLLNGSPIAIAGTMVTVEDINLGKLKFQPAPNASGSPYSSFTFQVQDDGGIEPYSYPGAEDLDRSAKIMTINVTAQSMTLSSSQTLRLNTAPDVSLKIKQKEFKVQALPNPATLQFNIRLESPDGNTPMMVRTVDLAGKVIEVKRGLMAGQTLQLGSNYRPGIYFIELTQGDQRRIVKVVKQPD
jgi:VCBS repeat-containing protein